MEQGSKFLVTFMDASGHCSCFNPNPRHQFVLSRGSRIGQDGQTLMAGKKPAEKKISNHERHTLFWTIVGSIAGIVGAYFTYRALGDKHSPVPPAPKGVPPSIIRTGAVSNPSEPLLPSNKVTIVTESNQSVLTEAEQQLFEETKREGRIKNLLIPFLTPIAPAKKPSHSMIEPMVSANTNGLEAIYQFLRRTTNSETGQPWIPAAAPRGYIIGVADGGYRPPDWSDDEATARLLNERQRVLQKYFEVLGKAGTFGP